MTKPTASKFRIRRAAPLVPATGSAGAPAPACPVPPADKTVTAVQTASRAVRGVSAATDTGANDTGANDKGANEKGANDKGPNNVGATARRMAPPIPEDSEDAFAMAQRAVPAAVPPAARTSMLPATPQGMTGYVSGPAASATADGLDAARAEGLTGRQLRLARRVAQKHGLAVTSDYDAVRQLRAAGIDPFQRSTLLELVVPARSDEAPADSATGSVATTRPVQLPVKAATAKLPATALAAGLPATEVNPAERRAREVMSIQRDIARRRRRKLALMATRLTFFVFLPTLIVGYYFFALATPMYATKSEFLILQADSSGGTGLGSLLSGTQFATNQDSIAVQSYLQSRDAMLRLEQDIGFKEHFSQASIDTIQRLDPGSSDEAAYKVFQKNVKIGYDPTEGVIKMEIIAADPKTSQVFSELLIGYAEERVDDLSKRKREDQMGEARVSLKTAKEERRAAQEQLVALQEGTFLDPEGEIANIRALISAVELQLQEKDLALNAQLNNARPNRARVDALRTEVRLLREELGRQNKRMTDATAGETSLASKTAQIQMAQADLVTADLFLQSALQNEKQTELEANRQVRYLTTSVRPVAPDDPTYPRAFEDTVLAFLIFSGVYLMLSLTASILREQASS